MLPSVSSRCLAALRPESTASTSCRLLVASVRVAFAIHLHQQRDNLLPPPSRKRHEDAAVASYTTNGDTTV
jgi:hypothetical protein